ncbi:MAG: FtsX-like permease family protein [Clostridium sp.]
MYSKIALKNVKKSFKDYSIYFITLTLAVCIFYSFNSIGSQKALIEVSTSAKQYAETLTKLISYVSVFVAIILGSLILYANNFLIKKRNKELGIYMTLGMGKEKISRILIFETIIVGSLSLISGLALGLLISQGLSILVSKLFEFKMDEYSFVISAPAIWKTIMCFGIMFLLVMLFNTYIISKYKIIDLLTVGRKTEEIRFKNPIVYLVSFITCILALGIAYKMAIDVGLQIDNPKLLISIFLGIIGTVLFFFSLTGLILYILKKNKRIYFKGLNIFTIKQINSKVNTNFISMSIICLMLFITIGVLSTGFSFKNAMEAGLKGATPFDASATLYVSDKDKVKSVKESLDNVGMKFNKEDSVVYYNEYRLDTRIDEIIPLAKGIDYAVMYVKGSDYNKIRELNNEEPINLLENEVLILSNFSKVVPSIENYLKDNKMIKINDIEYKVKNEKVIQDNIQTYYMQNNIFTVIINDKFCDNARLVSSNVNINFNGKDGEKREVEFSKLLNEKYRGPDSDYENNGYVNGMTRTQVYEENKGMTTTILFVGIYLGIVFLISSMAVLALQQLSEASDSIERYVALKKLGTNQKQINKTIFTQTIIYFTLPIILALVHSISGVRVANDFIATYNKPDIGGASFITAGIFLIVYGVYFYTTYTGYKNIVKSKMK